ncbi:MAG: hypothetical protein OIF51_07750 [Cellvibrionaceae bacterium]|nr:hypothetical protein [Cellvibrionaceae bacterium]
MGNNNEVNAKGKFELHSATYHEDLEWVKFCVESGCDISLKDNYGWNSDSLGYRHGQYF